MSMIAYTRAKLSKIIKLDFIRFCMVGGTGFIINFLILAFLHKILHTPLFLAQFIGAEVALFSNFLLHDRWTYKSKHIQKGFGTLLFQFHAVSWPAILGSAIMVSLGVKLLHMTDVSALAVSSILALIWNFSWSKLVIWKDIKADQLH